MRYVVYWRNRQGDLETPRKHFSSRHFSFILVVESQSQIAVSLKRAREVGSGQNLQFIYFRQPQTSIRNVSAIMISNTVSFIIYLFIYVIYVIFYFFSPESPTRRIMGSGVGNMPLVPIYDDVKQSYNREKTHRLPQTCVV